MRVPLLNFEGAPGVPLLVFEEDPGSQGPEVPGPGILVPLLHHNLWSQLYYKETPTQILSCEYFKIFKNTYFKEHTGTTLS